MTATHQAKRPFDLTPHPRILPMLGQIPLAQWRCIAELLDNSVDAFIEARRSGGSLVDPTVSITTPLNSDPAGKVIVRDNGPGMDADTLERAAKAGWSGRDPINNLGLFGMGFNIATARLGSKTTVWTTRSGDVEYTGLLIDFEQLTRKSSFATTALTRPKPDPATSGTEVIIERLKPEMREWFSKGANRTQIAKHLGRTYSAMLGDGAQPIKFKLELNGQPIRARPHCIWGGPGNPERSAQHPVLGIINAYQEFDFQLPQRKFCVSCWNWLAVEDAECPQCAAEGRIVERPRRVRGWLGIQRYQDESDFGIDFIRNGRKIEIGCKDLFAWRDPETEDEVSEYPIDDQRHRGRIVGEVHIDHCQVPYTKERFLREDAAWREMVTLVRGAGPLQPRIAEGRGLGGNSSPLYKLYQVYRRSSPQGRAGSWAKLLVVKDNARAQEMARKFENREPDYVTDAKWYALAEEEDNKALLIGGSTTGGATLGGATLGGNQAPPAPGPSPANPPASTGGQNQPPPTPRTDIAELSREYRDDLTGQRFNVRAFEATPSDEAALAGAPWLLRKTTVGEWEFIVVQSHEIFRSATMTPMDGLLAHLVHHAAEIERSQNSRHDFPVILSSLRRKFASIHRLDIPDLSRKAAFALKALAQWASEHVSKETLLSFFENECSPSMQESIRSAMARRGAPRPQAAVQDGRYFQYAPPAVVMEFVESHPEEFFDRKYWDEDYVGLEFGSPSSNEEARKSVLNYYSSLLADAVWLAAREDSDEASSRERLLRASLATDLLAPIAPSS